MLHLGLLGYVYKSFFYKILVLKNKYWKKILNVYLYSKDDEKNFEIDH